MKIKVVYATEVGTTRYVAEIIKETLDQEGHQVELYELSPFSRKPLFEETDVIILGSPTYYNGQPQEYMIDFLANFNFDLRNYKVAIFSLGDKGYQDFCGSAKKIEEWVVANHGKVSGQILKIDGYPGQTDFIRQWVKEMIIST